MDRIREKHSRIILDRDWLPAGSGIERIEELRAQHHAALDVYEEMAMPLHEAQERFWHEEHGYDRALREWYSGGQQGEQPSRTQKAEQEKFLAPLRQHANAAHEAVLDRVEAIERELAQQQHEWVQQLQGGQQAALARAAQLRREAEQVEAGVAGVDALCRWLGVTARGGRGGFGHQPSPVQSPQANSAEAVTAGGQYEVPTGGIETIDVEV